MPALIIVPYDPTWPEMFEAEAARIRKALGDLACRVDHVGSTGVPGLGAKPVIDIQVSVRQLRPMTTYMIPLHDLGYTHSPHPDDVDYPFFHRPAEWPHTHHIHVCQQGSVEERRHLAFRDSLRGHPAVAADYCAVKLSVASHFDADSFESRNAYADAKCSFIEPIVRRALTEGYGRL